MLPSYIQKIFSAYAEEMINLLTKRMQHCAYSLLQFKGVDFDTTPSGVPFTYDYKNLLHFSNVAFDAMVHTKDYLEHGDFESISSAGWLQLLKACRKIDSDNLFDILTEFSLSTYPEAPELKINWAQAILNGDIKPQDI